MGLTFLIKPYLAMLFLIIYLIKISLIMKPKLEYVIYFFLSIFLIIFIYDDSFISLLNRINLFIYNFNLEGSGYSTEDYITSFVGFAPAYDPAFVMLIKIDHPEKKKYGSEVAAPAFSKVGEYILKYLEIPRDR